MLGAVHKTFSLFKHIVTEGVIVTENSYNNKNGFNINSHQKCYNFVLDELFNHSYLGIKCPYSIRRGEWVNKSLHFTKKVHTFFAK